jgi:cytoskeleton protein RodZ
MPEIGDQLRETRMRNRIDITEVEAATKIRAKYLRALENEEWDLLPGPTFVTTFLRTYADYLGLDSRNLVEEYRQRYERPSTQDLKPFGTNLGGRRSRPRRPVVAPWMVIIVGVLVLVGALFAIGKWGDDDNPRHASDATATPTATAKPATKRKKRSKGAAKPGVVRLQIQPIGPVSVCLENAGGTPLIRNKTLRANQDTRTFRSRRFRVSFGTGAAVMRVNGKAYPVSDNAPIGYEVRAGGKPKALSGGARPDCGG